MNNNIIKTIFFFLSIACNCNVSSGLHKINSNGKLGDCPMQKICDLNTAQNYTSVVLQPQAFAENNILKQVNRVEVGPESLNKSQHHKTVRRFAFPQQKLAKESANTFSPDDAERNPFARHIHQVTDEIINNNKFVDRLTPETVIDLPVGIRKTIMGIDYILAVDSIVITSTRAYLVAYMSLDIPQVGKLAFAGKEIFFTQTGGFSGDVILQLIEAPKIPFGSEISLELLPEKTFAVFDCTGFKHIGVGGEFIFSRNLLIPEIDSVTYVKANFEAPMISNWNDLVIDISFDSFQINGLKDFTFIAEKAVLDFSDLKNPAGLELPQTIASYYDGEINLWRGFSLQKLTVKLPSQFKNDELIERIAITVYDLLIDETGFTGNISMDNILSIDKGRMGNWAFSVDQLHVHIESNQFISVGLDGQVLVPLFNKDTDEGTQNDSSLTQYKAIINPGGEYLFSMTFNYGYSF